MLCSTKIIVTTKTICFIQVTSMLHLGWNFLLGKGRRGAKWSFTPFAPYPEGKTQWNLMKYCRVYSHFSSSLLEVHMLELGGSALSNWIRHHLKVYCKWMSEQSSNTLVLLYGVVKGFVILVMYIGL